MPLESRLQDVQDLYRAFASGDRAVVERLLAEDFTFSSPPDPLLDRTGFFERCWPHAGFIKRFEFTRQIESGDEVVLTYEAVRPDDTRFRNTEVLTFCDGQVSRSEVYFGWDLLV